MEDVRHATRAAPAERSLRGERAPTGDDDDLRRCLAQRAQDADGERVVVPQQPFRARHAQPV
jgi:hypothetical protein